jgi:type III secretion system needle length determinant
MPEGVSLPFAAQQPAQIPPFHTAAVAAEPAKHVKPEGDTQPLTAAPLTLPEALKTIVSIAAGDAHPVDSHGAAAPVAPANDSRAQDDAPQDEPTRDLPLVDDPPDAFAALMTPGDKLLARLQPTPAAPVLTRDVQQLLSALQPHIQCAVTPTGSASVVQVHLPQLGHVEVQLVTIHGQLQVDIQASPGSLLQLQLARHELLERLQRVSPEQPVHLSFSNAQDGDQRSRQRRSVYDEWEPQP